MGSIRIGVDIGQAQDPTAIAVVETETQSVRPNAILPARTQTIFRGRYIGRLPLRTPYTEVSRRLLRLVVSIRSVTSSTPPSMFIDATGVGRPIVDMIRSGGLDQVCSVTPVTFTGTDRLEYKGLEARVGKAFLASRLQALLETHRILMPDTEEARALAQELKDYEIKIDDNGRLTAGASSGAHDDLATALGLAVLKDPAEGSFRTWGSEGTIMGNILDERKVGF